jgi:hypothetical protein
MSKLPDRSGARQLRDKHGAGTQSIDGHINGLLKAMYGEIENEQIPDRFLELLERLDEVERIQSAPKQN